MAVTPFVAVDDRQQRVRADLADALQGIFEPALLGGHLGFEVGVLGGAASAHPEMGTGRGAASRTLAQHPRDLRLVERAAPPGGLGLDHLPGQRAFDEHDLAVIARDAAPFRVERLDT